MHNGSVTSEQKNTANDSATKQRIIAQLAQELSVESKVATWQITAAIELLDSGSTVPFIARYRKEVTGMLSDSQLRLLEERLRYLRELEERRAAVLEAIAEAGKLTDQLAEAIAQASTKAELEDLYLPFKSKRRTKAQIAREAGLEPLADLLLSDPMTDPVQAAASYLNAEAGFSTDQDVLSGARSIVTERVSQDVVLAGELRERLWNNGKIGAKVGRASCRES